jgi:hypothetical protein
VVGEIATTRRGIDHSTGYQSLPVQIEHLPAQRRRRLEFGIRLDPRPGWD